MTSPAETVTDRLNAQVIATRIEKEWDVVLWATGQYDHIDFHVANKWEDHVAELEVKHRNVPHDTYDSLPLNQRKYKALMDPWVLYGIPGIYAVGFNDGVVLWLQPHLLKVSTLTIRFFGQRQRVKAVSDYEPVIMVPRTLFNTLGDGTKPLLRRAV